MTGPLYSHCHRQVEYRRSPLSPAIDRTVWLGHKLLSVLKGWRWLRVVLWPWSGCRRSGRCPTRRWNRSTRCKIRRRCPETGFCTTEGTCVTYYTEGGSERRCLDHDNMLHRGVCAFNSIKGSSTHVDCCKEDLCNNVKNDVSESSVSIYSDQANVLKLVISMPTKSHRR